MTEATVSPLSETPYWSQPVTFAELIAETLDWYQRNPERAGPRLDAMERELPSGSGIDSGTKINRDPSDPRPGPVFELAMNPDSGFVLDADWHAMDSNGYYAGWYGFRVFVTSTFRGPVVAIEWDGGKNPEEATEEDYAEANADDSEEWIGVSDPTDHLIDVYSCAMVELHSRLEFDAPPVAERLPELSVEELREKGRRLELRGNQ